MSEWVRVATFEADDDAVEAMVKEISAAEGPPLGIPAKSIVVLADRANGRARIVVRFDSEENLRAGSAALDAMEPPARRERTPSFGRAVRGRARTRGVLTTRSPVAAGGERDRGRVAAVNPGGERSLAVARHVDFRLVRSCSWLDGVRRQPPSERANRPSEERRKRKEAKKAARNAAASEGTAWQIATSAAIPPPSGGKTDVAYLVTLVAGSATREVVVEFATSSTVASSADAEEATRGFLRDEEPPRHLVVEPVGR